jgi:hypothetical protein
MGREQTGVGAPTRREFDMKAAGSPTNGPHDGLGVARLWLRRRSRPVRVLTAACAALVSMVAIVAQGAESAPPAAAAAGPKCTFTAPTHTLLGVVLNTTPGEVVNTACTGLPASTEFLQVELSLTAAIDPSASTLLTGGSVTSVAGLLSLIAITPELNALSENFSSSNSSGVLNVNYTVPSTQPTDPNSSCPPSTEEFNSGLIGCAVAMIDLSDFKPVTAGTFVLHYPGPFLPPAPTFYLSPQTLITGQSVKASDAPGATTYWWVATLASLESLLSGGAAPSSFPMTLHVGGRKARGSDVSVTPASYNNETFTPPVLSGSFIARGHGKKTKVVGELGYVVLGLGLASYATAYLHILKY